jgi:hypothetical protein
MIRMAQEDFVFLADGKDDELFRLEILFRHTQHVRFRDRLNPGAEFLPEVELTEQKSERRASCRLSFQ